MGIYERHLLAAGVWGDPFRADAADMPMPMVPMHLAAVPTVTVATPPPPVEAEDVEFGKRLAQQDDVGVPASMGGEAPPPSSDSFGHGDDDDDAYARPPRDSKVQRRLAQNREAARKSRLRKKAYIQNLETSRMKLAQLEQELTMARRHQVQVQVQVRTTNTSSGGGGGGGLLVAAPPPPSSPSPAVADPRIAAFEQEYARWVEEQGRQATELRAALQSSPPDDDDDDALRLGVLVDAAMAHYESLFQAKARAARHDALFVLSGVWRAPAERLFLWIGGGPRPSDLLATLAPHLGPLPDRQAAQVRALRNTARQLEDALAQGLAKLQQTLLDALLAVDVDDYAAAARRRRQMDGAAVGKLADLANFVEKADHLRQQTLRNMHKILTPRQAARGMLALADYGHRLRALSSLWAARPRETA